MTFNLGGIDFELVPSFENLAALEESTNKPIYAIASNPKVSDAIQVLIACANKPKTGYPDWFTKQGVFEAINNEKKVMDICVFVVKFCTAILTAGSEHDIKTVGADDEGK